MFTFIFPLLLGTILGFLIRGKPSDTFAITKGRAAATELGFSEKNVPAALKGRVKSLKGWKLSYITSTNVRR